MFFWCMGAAIIIYDTFIYLCFSSSSVVPSIDTFDYLLTQLTHVTENASSKIDEFEVIAKIYKNIQ